VQLQTSDLLGRLREGKAKLDDPVDRFHPHLGRERVETPWLDYSGRDNVGLWLGAPAIGAPSFWGEQRDYALPVKRGRQSGYDDLG